MNDATARAQETQGNASDAQGGAPEQSGEGIGTGVGATVSEPSGVAGSESPLSGQLNPATIYQLYPDNPESKLTGAQIRENLIRAGQFDQIQGELHKTQAELEQSAGRAAAVEEELEGIKRQQAVAEQIKAMGLKPQAAPGPQESGDEWLYDNDQGKPTAAPQVDPVTMARQIYALVEKSIQEQLGDVDVRVDKRTAEQFERETEERQYREGVDRTHSSLRSAQANSLREGYGLDERQIDEVLDMIDVSRVMAAAGDQRYREGMKARTPTERAKAVEEAREQLLQSSSYMHSAVGRLAEAKLEFDKLKVQKDAAEALESQSYANMPRPDEDTAKPASLSAADIAKYNAENLAEGHKDVDKTSLLRSQLGPRSP